MGINAYQIVKDFEQAMADFMWAPFAVAVESCSAALFLCCLYEKVKEIPEVVLPKFTYPSAPNSVVNAGGRVRFENIDWQGIGWYLFRGTRIVDSAKRLTRDGYFDKTLTCLSFHAKKTIPIGRGGMILTDDKAAADWLKTARFDGRHEMPLPQDNLAGPGWNMYMSPAQAARGLELMQWIADDTLLPPDPYLDLSKQDFYEKANRC
jgi:dTDP-4-amino-4,6-dideoxygalactose transaminase